MRSYTDYIFRAAVAISLVGILVWFFSNITRSINLAEAEIFYYVSGSFSDIFERSSYFHGYPGFYNVCLWLLLRVMKPNEWVMRLPALLGALAALWLLYKMMADLFGKRHASVALLIAGFSMPAMPELFMWSRAHGLAAGFMMCMLWSAVKIAERSIVSIQLLYALSATALGFTSMHFWPSFILPLLLTAASCKREMFWSCMVRITALTAGPFVFVYTTLALSWNNLHSHLLSLKLWWVPDLTVNDVLYVLFPSAYLVWAAIIIIALVVIRPEQLKFEMPNFYYAALMGIWFFLPTLVCYAVSVKYGRSVMLPRYALWGYFAPVLLLANFIVSNFTQKAQNIVLGLGSVAVVFASILPATTKERWRDLKVAFSQMNVSEHTPVLTNVGYIESVDVSLLNNPLYRGYFSVPFLYYNIPGQLRFLTWNVDDEAKVYLDELLGTLGGVDPIYYVGHLQDMPAKVYVDKYMKAHGYLWKPILPVEENALLEAGYYSLSDT